MLKNLGPKTDENIQFAKAKSVRDNNIKMS